MISNEDFLLCYLEDQFTRIESAFDNIKNGYYPHRLVYHLNVDIDSVSASIIFYNLDQDEKGAALLDKTVELEEKFTAYIKANRGDLEKIRAEHGLS